MMVWDEYRTESLDDRLATRTVIHQRETDGWGERCDRNLARVNITPRIEYLGRICRVDVGDGVSCNRARRVTWHTWGPGFWGMLQVASQSVICSLGRRHLLNLDYTLREYKKAEPRASHLHMLRHLDCPSSYSTMCQFLAPSHPVHPHHLQLNPPMSLGRPACLDHADHSVSSFPPSPPRRYIPIEDWPALLLRKSLVSGNPPIAAASNT